MQPHGFPRLAHASTPRAREKRKLLEAFSCRLRASSALPDLDGDSGQHRMQ